MRTEMIQTYPHYPSCQFPCSTVFWKVFNERFLSWSIYEILELHCSEKCNKNFVLLPSVCGSLLSPLACWLSSWEGKDEEGVTECFVYSPWAEMKGGLREIDLSELAQLYSKYKEYIRLRNLETNHGVSYHMIWYVAVGSFRTDFLV